jgi:hypothetical protein
MGQTLSPYDQLAGEQEAVLRECDDPANPGHPHGIRARRANALAALTHLRVLQSGRTDPERVAEMVRNMYRLLRGSAWKLPAGKLLTFFLGDFESMWEVFAKNEDERPRCNFAFGLLAMTLLELVCHCCRQDKQALQEFTEALDARDRRYFWRLPKPFPGDTGYMKLPAVRGVPHKEQLLSALFDIVRNGQAHQYHQMFVELQDGGFGVGLTGAPKGALLTNAETPEARRDHLSMEFDLAEQVLALKLRPDVLFCDLRYAIRAAQLCDRNLSLAHFPSAYAVSLDELKASFEAMNSTAKEAP